MVLVLVIHLNFVMILQVILVQPTGTSKYALNAAVIAQNVQHQLLNVQNVPIINI
jgi:hypothetical protein